MAMASSIHTARWVNQLDGEGWDIHIFNVYNTLPHPSLRNVTVYGWPSMRGANLDKSVRLFGLYPFARGRHSVAQAIEQGLPSLVDRSVWLAWLIRWLKPDLIHSLEIQHAGYITLGAKERISGEFPEWIVTNWGADIHLFGRLAEHASKVKKVLASCNYYSCECERDVDLAKEMGLTAQILPIFPNTGGFSLEKIAQFRSPGLTSSRRLIVLKGYQHWAGRALVGLRALELCANELAGYRIAIFSAPPEVRISAELFSQSVGIPIDLISGVSHDEMLRLHGQARISIGLSISDAISISLLEAMVMGSFPIQSCTACAAEWITDGRSGFIVPPEDSYPIASAIRQAIWDDSLVDKAAELNAEVARTRLDREVIRQEVVKMYKSVLGQATSRSRDG